MRKRFSNFLIILVLVLGIFITGCEKPVPIPVNIEHREQDSENLTLLKYRNGEFTFEKDGKKVKLDKNEIKEIQFGKSKTESGITTTGDTTTDSKEFEKYEKYFKMAEEIKNKYPDVEGATLYDYGEWKLNPDGTRKYLVKSIQVIFKPSAKSWGQFGHYLDKQRFEINVMTGRTITPDGKIYDMDSESIKITKPTSGEQFYSRGEVFTFTLPNVEVGNLVEFEYEVNHFNPYNPDIFQGRFYFAGLSPVKFSQLKVVIPKSKKLRYTFRNMAKNLQKPEIKTAGDDKVFIWTVEDSGPMIREPMMPSLADVLPKIAFTTTPSWDYLMEWSNNMIKDKIEVTPKIEETVEKIVNDAEAKTKEEKLAAIYHWVQKNIKYISIKGDISTGWTGHPAEETLNNGYGDCIDKSILFVTMLKVVDIEAYPISVRTRGEGTAIREIPLMDANHAITEVHLNGKKLILDATTPPFRYPYFPTMDKGITYVNEIRKEKGFIPYNKPDENSWLIESSGELLENGNLQLEEKWDFVGDNEAGFKNLFQTYKGAFRTQVFQNFLNSVSPGAILEDLKVKHEEEIAPPLKMSLKYTLPKYPVFAHDLVIVKMPVNYRFPEIGLKERKFDLIYNSANMQGHKLKIKIPSHYNLEYLPKPIHIKSKYIEYKGSYVLEGNNLVFEDYYKILNPDVPREEYQKHKRLLQRISKFNQEQVFFSIKK